jgi:hypothetical protein
MMIIERLLFSTREREREKLQLSSKKKESYTIQLPTYPGYSSSRFKSVENEQAAFFLPAAAAVVTR